MNRRRSKSMFRALAGALALLTTVLLLAPPALASELRPKAQATEPAASAQRATLIALAEARVEAAAPAEVLAAQVAPDSMPVSSESGRSFFKTPKGIAAVILIVGGTAFAFAKRSDDRIKSSVR